MKKHRIRFNLDFLRKYLKGFLLISLVFAIVGPPVVAMLTVANLNRYQHYAEY